MKGSTMDAMSDAIEGADVMLYGVSLRYKESANCRLEAVSFLEKLVLKGAFISIANDPVLGMRRRTTPISRSWT